MTDDISLADEVNRLLGERFQRTTIGLRASTEGPVHVSGEPEERMNHAVALREQILELTRAFDEALRGL